VNAVLVMNIEFFHVLLSAGNQAQGSSLVVNDEKIVLLRFQRSRVVICVELPSCRNLVTRKNTVLLNVHISTLLPSRMRSQKNVLQSLSFLQKFHDVILAVCGFCCSNGVR
jgi:hypothetical protein